MSLVEVEIEVDFRDVTQGLAEDRLECSFVDLVVKRDGEGLPAAGQKLPTNLDVAAFLVNSFEAELREDLEDVLTERA